MKARTAREEQKRQLKRVKRRIGDIVLDFCHQHLGKQFRMIDLEMYVQQEKMTTPGSAGRILRELKREGVIDYIQLDRGNSLYYLKKVEEFYAPDEPPAVY